MAFHWTNDEQADRLRALLPSLEEATAPVERAKAIGDGARYQLLVLLEDGPNCVADLAQLVMRDQSVVSRHFAKLEAAGLVEKRRSGKLSLFEITDAGRDLLRAVRGR